MDSTIGLIIAAGTGGVIYSLKKIPKDIYDKIKGRLVYSAKVYQYDELFSQLERWLYDHHNKSYRDVEASLQSVDNKSYPNNDDEKKQLVYKQEETSFILKYHGKKLLISKSKEKMDKAETAKDYFFRKFTISGWRAMKQIDQLLNEVIKYNDQKRNNGTVQVYSNNAHGEWCSPSVVRVKPIDKVIFAPEVKEKIISDVDEFIKTEDWYLSASIPYKRGFCFYGPPGTGKTTMALALAAYTRRNVYCMNLSCLLDDSKVPQLFKYIRDNSILLLEDFDKVFCGRENVGDTKVTFSTILNCLDGALARYGLITVITTNHIEKLDPALLRTGRMDVKIEVPKPGRKEIEEYMSLFYGEEIKFEGDFESNLTMSDIQEICIQNKNTYAKAYKALCQKARQFHSKVVCVSV
jgi:chaperone BCS1